MAESMDIHPRSFLATATREELVERILADVERVKERDERVREAIREQAKASADREAAIDLAEQYARKAGIDVSRDDLLRGVADYWRLVEQWQKAYDEAQAQRWDVQRFALDLTKWAEDGRLVNVTGAEVAEKVGNRLGELFSAQGRAPGRSKDLFKRPAAPQLELVPDLAEEADRG